MPHSSTTSKAGKAAMARSKQTRRGTGRKNTGTGRRMGGPRMDRFTRPIKGPDKGMG